MDSSRYSIASGLSMGRRRHNANQFNIMVTGHSLSGKSSFIRTFQHTLNIKNKKGKQPEKKKIENHLNDLKIIDDENSSIAISLSPEMREELKASQEIETFDFPPRNIIKPVASDVLEIIEDGERINLRLIDTPGLPIPVHNISKNASDFDPKVVGEWCTSILLYIENQYEITLLEESRVRRNRRFPDSQVHICLYLIDATTASVANGLTAIDIITIQKLSERVNLVPCLSKADLMTVKQLERIKKAIRNDIDEHNLPIYMFDDDEDDDQDIKDQNAMFRNMIPFVLVNAEEVEVGDRIGIEYIEEDGKNILGRQYTWGTVDVENPEHCDFCDVKTFLLETHINELKQLTKDYYYESWRTNKLMEVKGAISKPVVSSGLRQSASIPPPNGNISPPSSNQNSPMVVPNNPQQQQPQQPIQMQAQPLTPQQVAMMAATNSYQPNQIDEQVNIPEVIKKPHRRTASKADSIKSFNSTHSKPGAQVVREE
ncbi:Septin-domain-containing protein [Anaeromyces robustus]|uniref:Septin-domain-containing protein n=1 Tax=Anaeromyces robustus TaxID=1754192 RepID=A0A1Y1VRH2_9FUNG|nr:Septin-domain-containing protein [Anaeromyces robustus]|eukprot:ORX63891.1 Septin-domain-containing protein [Anaeromyces robustus]